MLHEILLSLSGHSSPLLRPDEATRVGSSGSSSSGSSSDRGLTPPERALLADLARLGELHMRLRTQATRIAAAHPSVVCRAVAAAVVSVHLAAFQRDVLAVEATVLRDDAALVGAYGIVPLTAVAGAFADWPRRMEWLWAAVVRYILPEGAEGSSGSSSPSGAQLIDHLRGELQTGYEDVERTARSLVRVAETAWLKQVSAWILYGRLPSLGAGDFFVQQTAATADAAGDYVCVAARLPAFVAPATAASMLFIGRSLVHLRAQTDSGARNGPKARHWLDDHADRADRADHKAAAAAAAAAVGDYHLSTQLQALARLTHPLDSATFARTIAHVRAVLSRTALRRLLPPAKVVDMLQLLRDFFLLGRGAFAMALVEQADETMRSRWQRADGGAGGGGGGVAGAPPTTAGGLRGLRAVIVKDGEVASVLARTWAVLGAMHGRHANADEGEEEDEGMELARETLRLVLHRSTSSPAAAAAGTGESAGAAPTHDPATPAPATPVMTSMAPQPHGITRRQAAWLRSIAAAPFPNLLFSVPAALTLQIPYPLDLVLSTADLQAYAAIHAYLLSIRRAHIRLTGLWRLSSLRRLHPPPPGPPYGGRGGGHYRLEHAQMLRARYTERADALRSMWATTSAAIFFLAEVESYLQIEVVAELWDGFQRWLTTGRDDRGGGGGVAGLGRRDAAARADAQDEDIWLAEAKADDSDTETDTDADTDADADARPQHDPQSLATAHQRYLRRLVRRLLLDRGPRWTEPLYALLVAVDQLAALVQRLQALWQALDLEADAGVVDAFVDLDREQLDALDALAAAERGVRRGVLAVVGVLRDLEREADEAADEEADEDDAADGDDPAGDDDAGTYGRGAAAAAAASGLRSAGAYVPRRVGGLDHLLMKLDFGSWGDKGAAHE